MAPLKMAYMEEWDNDFIRWTSNLFRSFLDEGRVVLVRRDQQPDLILASVWNKHVYPAGIPVILISNENWKLFPPHEPLGFYKAVLGLYPPGGNCTFIGYPYGAVHFDLPVGDLYRLREELLGVEKTRFCCFVTSNAEGSLAQKRIALFQAIHRWRRVDSAGKVLNNVNYLAPRGLDFLRWIAQYKYMICLENSKEPNYITEKPFQAWFAGTVPIYDGGCVEQLNHIAILNAASGNVPQQLKVLEHLSGIYEIKRRADLCPAAISLASFEEKFRALVLDPRDVA